MTSVATGDVLGPLPVESLANGGKGIARTEGRVLFVANAFPGDLIRCRLTKVKKNYAEAEVVDLLQPSPRRRQPPCPVADRCGGCQWQQLPYSEQLAWKQRLFSDTLVRQGKVPAEAIRQIVPAPDEFGYRSRVQVKCAQTRAGFVTGFFRPKSRYVEPIEHCPVLPAALNQLLAAFRQTISASRLGQQIPQLDLSIDAVQKCSVVVHFLGGDSAPVAKLLQPLAEQHGCDLVLRGGKNSQRQLLAGDGELQVAVDQPEMLLKYAVGGFAQINLAQNRQLVQAALQAAELTGSEQVLDLYCGMGNFSLPFARRAKRVVGIEEYAPSIAMARQNASCNGAGQAEFYTMPAECALHKFEQPFDLILLDPPRSGAYDVCKQLVVQPARKIIYVSCDPQTLARDLNLLCNHGYRLQASQPFDMFPQTHHLESLSVLVADAKG